MELWVRSPVLCANQINWSYQHSRIKLHTEGVVRISAFILCRLRDGVGCYIDPATRSKSPRATLLELHAGHSTRFHQPLTNSYIIINQPPGSFRGWFHRYDEQQFTWPRSPIFLRNAYLDRLRVTTTGSVRSPSSIPDIQETYGPRGRYMWNNKRDYSLSIQRRKVYRSTNAGWIWKKSILLKKVKKTKQRLLQHFQEVYVKLHHASFGITGEKEIPTPIYRATKTTKEFITITPNIITAFVGLAHTHSSTWR